MATRQWQGLITNASPYALPSGAAAEQVNLTTHIAGQLTTRKGMAAFGSLPDDTVQMAVGYRNGAVTYLSVNLAGELQGAAAPDPWTGLTAVANPVPAATANKYVYLDYAGFVYKPPGG